MATHDQGLAGVSRAARSRMSSRAPRMSLMYDFEVYVGPTVKDVMYYARIKCAHCPYVTMAFWSLRESEKDFWRHYMRKHGMK